MNPGIKLDVLNFDIIDCFYYSHHYAAKAFLRDEEAVTIIMNHFLGNCDRQRLLISLVNVFLQCYFNSMLYYSGLLELNFDLNYNTPSLNQWTVYTLQLSGIWEPPSAPAATMAVKTTGICIDYKEIYLYNYKLRDTDYQLSDI